MASVTATLCSCVIFPCHCTCLQNFGGAMLLLMILEVLPCRAHRHVVGQMLWTYIINWGFWNVQVRVLRNLWRPYLLDLVDLAGVPTCNTWSFWAESTHMSCTQIVGCDYRRPKRRQHWQLHMILENVSQQRLWTCSGTPQELWLTHCSICPGHFTYWHTVQFRCATGI